MNPIIYTSILLLLRGFHFLNLKMRAYFLYDQENKGYVQPYPENIQFILGP